MSPRPTFVVAGVGNGFGTGAATARVFAKAGYNIALIARNADSLKKFAEEIKGTGGEAAAFPIENYSGASIQSAFASIKSQWPSSPLRVALWNAAFGVWKPFLELKPEEIQESVDTNIVGAFAFSREAITAFKDLAVDEQKGKRGTLLFTGATASLRGNTTTSAFAAGKFGLRGLSQSLAKEFGKENIHVAHAIMDGVILTDRSKAYVAAEKRDNPDAMLNPESIGNSYLYLANQDRSAWTWELDLRPAHEKW
ncbi:NAD-P-binding protein [Athelia psychrophila]|uniref:NAD-P-binding protein n=1 Tax=Athelia psychrophila TaxID=1759441 RepID=A0A165Z8B9_9AGAM|nr:NAD-P-binding protein [Fibularhizoctonia sp. CBS 109695]